MGQKLILAIAVVALAGGAWWFMGQGTSAPAVDSRVPDSLGTTEQKPVQAEPQKAAPAQAAPTTKAKPKPTSQTAPTTSTGSTEQGSASQVAPTETPGTPAPATSETPVPTVTATENIAIQSFAFGSGGSVTVKKGTRVTWTNNDTAPHTVTSTQGGVANGTFESGNLNSGSSFTFTFDTPGTYTYICKYHPSMKGTIIVTE